MALDAGQLLHDRYRIDRLIARGGYGAVYQAYDLVLKRACAVKENLASDVEAAVQFEQEALILANLHHPNLTRVVDHFVTPDGRQYLVMDYVAGRNLDEIQRQRGRPFGEAEAMAIVQPVCDALSYLHRQNPPIVHRDVKPQNIVITPANQVMLVDFGLSKRLVENTNTVPGARGVTPGYTAPEQYGLAPTDPRSDVYSLGATLYTMLTGQRPPDALQRMTNELMLAPIGRLNPAVSAPVQEAVQRALTVPIARRLQSVEELQAMLLRAGSRRRRWPRVAPSGMVAAGLAGVALLLAITLTARIWQPPLAPTGTPTTAPLPPMATPPGGGGHITFVSSRDGNQEIYRIEPDGSNPVNLTAHPADDWVPSWSPDGRLLAFASDRSGNWDIYVLEVATGALAQLTFDPAEDHDPEWAPDGSRLLFHSNRSGYWRLYTMTPDGDNVQPLTDDPAGDWAGTWSPDGSRIAYAHNFGMPGEIYLMNADGSNQVNLTNSGEHESAARWSPDGSRLVFYSDRDGNRELYSMNPDGSGQTRLTSHPAVDTLAGWSPDSRRIVFTSDRDGNTELYTLDLATGVVERLTENAAEDSGPLWTPN